MFHSNEFILKQMIDPLHVNKRLYFMRNNYIFKKLLRKGALFSFLQIALMFGLIDNRFLMSAFSLL